MQSIPQLPSPRVLVLIGPALILIGLAVKGFFTSRAYRRQRINALLILLTGLLLVALITAAGRTQPSLLKAESILIKSALSAGRFLAGWVPREAGIIELVSLLVIIVITPLLVVFKKRPARPFLLLLLALGAALIGGVRLSYRQITPAIGFLGLSCLYAWLGGLASRKIPPPSPPRRLPTTGSFLLLAGIIVLAFVLRSYGLGEVSYRFDHRESDYAHQALKVLSGHHNLTLWSSTEWRGLGHNNLSPVYTYCVALFFSLFGVSLPVLKLVSVIFGMSAVLLTYGIVNILFQKRLALIAAFFLAVSPLHINYSRIGLLLSSTLTMGLLIIYLLLRSLLLGKYLSFILLGLVAVFAGYFYSPIRYPILLAGVLLGAYAIFKWKSLPRNCLGILLLIFAIFLITLAFNVPSFGLMAPHFEDYESVWHRTQGHLYTYQPDYIRAIPLIGENFQKLTRSLFLDRRFSYDPWPRGNLYFNPVLPVLMLLGVAYSLANIKKPNYRLLLFFSAAFFLPNLFSRPAVMVRRMMMSWPFLYCLAAIPVSQFLKKTRELFSRTTSNVIAGGVVLALLAVGAYNCHIFFDNDREAGWWERERYFDDYAKKLLDDYSLYITPLKKLSRKTIDFLLREKVRAGDNSYQYVTCEQLSRWQRKDLPSDRPVAVVCAPGRVPRSTLEDLKTRLGEGRIEERRDKFNRLIAYVLILD